MNSSGNRGKIGGGSASVVVKNYEKVNSILISQ